MRLWPRLRRVPLEPRSLWRRNHGHAGHRRSRYGSVGAAIHRDRPAEPAWRIHAGTPAHRGSGHHHPPSFEPPALEIKRLRDIARYQQVRARVLRRWIAVHNNQRVAVEVAGKARCRIDHQRRSSHNKGVCLRDCLNRANLMTFSSKGSSYKTTSGLISPRQCGHTGAPW